MALTSPRRPGGQPSRSAKLRGGMMAVMESTAPASFCVVVMLVIINVRFSGETLLLIDGREPHPLFHVWETHHRRRWNSWAWGLDLVIENARGEEWKTRVVVCWVQGSKAKSELAAGSRQKANLAFCARVLDRSI